MPNLEFVKDDVRNISKYGSFDVSFCSGLLYHLDKPAEFLQTVADQTKSILVLQTHFAPNQTAPKKTKSKGVLGFSKRREVPEVLNYNLSPLTENEGFQGRWFNEPGSKDDDSHWASWGNSKSFWLTRPSLMQVLQNVGFDLVFEQFDNLTPTIAESMESGFYAENYRSTFIAVKVP